MKHDSKSVSLITQCLTYLSFPAINFCSSSRNMTAVPCTGRFAKLNLLSGVGTMMMVQKLHISEKKQGT